MSEKAMLEVLLTVHGDVFLRKGKCRIVTHGRLLITVPEKFYDRRDESIF